MHVIMGGNTPHAAEDIYIYYVFGDLREQLTPNARSQAGCQVLRRISRDVLFPGFSLLTLVWPNYGVITIVVDQHRTHPQAKQTVMKHLEGN
jgi:hypothetical protein